MMPKTILRQIIERIMPHAGSNYHEGMTIVSKAAMRHRWLVLSILLFNAFAAIFEGSTMGILVVAASALVDPNAVHALLQRLGDLGLVLQSFLKGIGTGGLFLGLVALAVVAQILKSLMTYWGKYVAILLQFRVSKELLTRSTDQIMAYSYSEVTKWPAGSLEAFIGQTSNIAGVVKLFNQAVLALIMLVTYLGVMTAMSLELAGSAMAVVVVIWLGISGTSKAIKRLGVTMVDAVIYTGKVSVEFLQAPRLLRVFGATQYAGEKINTARNKALAAGERSAKIKAIVDPSVDALSILAAGIFLVAGDGIRGGSAVVIIPKLLVFLLILNRMVPQAKTLNQTRMSFNGLIHSIEVIGSFLRTTDKGFVRVGGSVFPGLKKNIKFRDVSFMYPGASGNVLSNLNLNIAKGQTVALVGSSGAGKSTIASLLLGLYEPSTGRIEIDGKDLQTLDLESWRDHIGTVDQEIFLLNESIKENVSFATDRFTLEDVRRACRLAHADNFIEQLPKGYDTIVGDRGLRLSGGQQQRLALARALVRSPEVLILDEATSSLDSESERLIQQTLEELHNTVTIFVIAHRLSTIAKADQILVLDNGQIQESGAFGDLADSGGLFDKLWRLQAVKT